MLTFLIAPVLAAAPWGACPDGDPVGVCRTLSVPQDHDRPDGPRIALAVKRYEPAAAGATGQIWHITGGPGDSGLAALQNLEGFSEQIAPDYALMSLDVRGVGFSERLGCAEEEAPDSPEGRALDPDEWARCAARLEGDERLATLTTTQTALDVIAVVNDLREAGPVVLWGVSYGTFLVDRMIAIQPDVADAVILDGVVPPDWTFLEFDRGVDEVARAYAARCTEDPSCATHLGSDPAQFAETVFSELEGRCPRIGIDARLGRLLGGVFLLGAESTADQLPVVWHRLGRCKRRDVRAFIHLFDALFPEEGDQEDPTHAPVLQRHIAYTDLWGPTPPQSELRATVDQSIATTEVTLSFGELAADWPSTEPGPDHRAPPLTDVPMLVMHGGFDPTMPLDRARDRAKWLNADHQTFVAVPEAFHVTFNQGECPASIYTQFLANPSAELDLSCIDTMPRLGFAPNPSRDLEIWGVADRWGEDRGCSTGPTRWLGLGFGMAWLLRRRRRQR
ncbi:MAG: alpha/beta fold hydrolase [Myxococcota bacterium]